MRELKRMLMNHFISAESLPDLIILIVVVNQKGEICTFPPQDETGNLGCMAISVCATIGSQSSQHATGHYFMHRCSPLKPI